jgi:hypothetical protein
MNRSTFFRAAIAAVLFCAASFCAALDFGAVIHAEGTIKGADKTEGRAQFRAAPWLSVPLDKADLYFSAGVSGDYQSARDPASVFIPELFHTEFSFKPLETMNVRAGRIPYTDPTRFTALGLFDGAAVSMDLGRAQLEAAVFYTGFLYKKTASLRANSGDPVNYDIPLDWSDFAHTYFAPPNVIAAVQGEYRGFLFPNGILHAGILGKFDLSDAQEKRHTQFLLLRYTAAFKAIDLSAAGAVELIPQKGNVRAAFAAGIEGAWRIPTAVPSRLSLGFRWASGEAPSAAAYDAVISNAQGQILEADFSGLMVIRPLYEVRFLPSLAAEAGCRYFIRTDSITFSDPAVDGDDSYMIGLEADAAILWAPFSDLSVSVSGAVFFPRTGKVFKKDAPVRGTVTLGVTFSL